MHRHVNSKMMLTTKKHDILYGIVSSISTKMTTVNFWIRAYFTRYFLIDLISSNPSSSLSYIYAFPKRRVFEARSIFTLAFSRTIFFTPSYVVFLTLITLSREFYVFASRVFIRGSNNWVFHRSIIAYPQFISNRL